MQSPLTIFNWSLKKLLQTHTDAFTKAKAKILFWILLFSLAKIIVALTVSWYWGQDFQFQRALILLGIYTVLLKVFLANKAYLNTISHLMLSLGLLLIWSNIFMYAQTLNIISSQFIVMLIISSFYLVSVRMALIYCTLGIFPVITILIFKDQFAFNLIQPNPLASPGYEIIIFLNFVTIILCHYLFKQAFANNLAEKETLNLKLQVAVKEANLAAASKTEFLSTMSHELRTPLNAVIGISELLLTEGHTKEQEENLNILKFSAGNLHILINDILDFNKLGSGKLTLEAIPVDIAKLMQDLSRSLRFQAVQKGIKFELDSKLESGGQRVITDPTRITQIINNLAGNAIKFTSSGSVTLGLKVLNSNTKDISIQIFVSDTGIGIPEENKESIFEPFTQASFSTTRNFGGTGLGLAIVKQLLFLFNSNIKVESTPGIGSIFSFDLVLPLSTKIIPTDAPALEKDYDLNNLRILVAEDNPMNRLLLVKIFSKWNVQVTFASNGQEAVEKLQQAEFDVVLMDLHMPEMDGYEASRIIRSLPDPLAANIKIIALSASVSSNQTEKIKEAGMNGFILKPFKMDVLYSCLKEEVVSSV